MILSHERPPNYEDIKSKLGDVWEQGVVLAYGNVIHTKRESLLPDVVLHETIHERQQGNSPSVWWHMYLTDMSFRLSQEREAYLRQSEFIKKYILDRNVRFKCLSEVAQDFASPLYGSIITYSDALQLLT